MDCSRQSNRDPRKHSHAYFILSFSLQSWTKFLANCLHDFPATRGFPLPFALFSGFFISIFFLLVALTTIRLAFCKCNLICSLKLPPSLLLSPSLSPPTTGQKAFGTCTILTPATPQQTDQPRPVTSTYALVRPGVSLGLN